MGKECMRREKMKVGKDVWGKGEEGKGGRKERGKKGKREEGKEGRKERGKKGKWGRR